MGFARGMVCVVMLGGLLNGLAWGQDSSRAAGISAAKTGNESAALDLPDSPGYSSSVRQQQQGNGGGGVASEILGGVAGGAEANSDPRRNHMARKYDKYIDRNEIPQMLSERDKVILGLRATATPFAGISIVAAAGYEQVTNGSPNYGTNSGAFAARVGAAAARDTSELVFSDSVLAPLLHEDPRYFQLGDEHGVIARTAYGISRVFITRNDQGRQVPNYSLLGGYAGAIALTNAYYPELNQGAKESAKSYGGSLGGAALGFVVREFFDDVIERHMKMN